MEECCLRALRHVRYAANYVIVGDVWVRPVLSSLGLVRCGVCGAIIGVCPYCFRRYGRLYMLPLDRGRRGTVPLCERHAVLLRV